MKNKDNQITGCNEEKEFLKNYHIGGWNRIKPVIDEHYYKSTETTKFQYRTLDLKSNKFIYHTQLILSWETL